MADELISISYLTQSENIKPPILFKVDEGGGFYFHDEGNEADPNIDVETFLSITEAEKIKLAEFLAQGYFLLGVKKVGGEYPDYFKKFHKDNLQLFLDSNEITISRTEKQDEEFILVKMPKVQKMRDEYLSPKTKSSIKDLKGLLEKILANMGDGK